MKFIKIGFSIWGLIGSLSLSSAQPIDTYNTYLWNRDNALAGNGQIDRGDWYEWWYYKVIDPATQEAFYFTYGVINPWDRGRELQGTRAVLQAGDFKSHNLIGQSFPVSEFESRYDRTYVRIGSNQATDRRLRGEVKDAQGHRIAWDLQWTLDWKFNAMGWATSSPGSGIYWYPAQASARATGWVESDGRRVRLENAPAYQDRNWGSAFPKWWTWIAANHFANAPGTSLAVGGGEPPVLGGFYLFSGLCIGLHWKNKDYIFRSIDVGDDVKFNIHWGTWHVQAQNSRNEYIEIIADAPEEKFMDLPFQTPRGPIFHDYEALLGHVHVVLYKWSSPAGRWQLLADLQTNQAGIEWGSPDPVSRLSSLQFEAR